MDDTRIHDTDPSTEEGPLATAPTPAASLVPALRSSLDAKLHRLLTRPIVARLGAPDPRAGEADCGDDGDFAADDLPLDFLAMLAASRETSPRRSSERAPLWHEDPRDGTTIVPIRLDYLDQWRGHEKEVLETVKSTVEESVTFLTDAHRRLLLQSPAEFLELQPAPEAIELVGYQVERVGGVERVVALIVAEPPKAPRPPRSPKAPAWTPTRRPASSGPWPPRTSRCSKARPAPARRRSSPSSSARRPSGASGAGGLADAYGRRQRGREAGPQALRGLVDCGRLEEEEGVHRVATGWRPGSHMFDMIQP